LSGSTGELNGEKWHVNKRTRVEVVLCVFRLFHNLKSECLEESGAKKEGKRAERAHQRLEKREYYAGLKAAGLLRTGQEVRRGQLPCGHIEEQNIDKDNADLFDLVK